MIAMRTAQTLEVDDIDDALEELYEQIDVTSLATYSAGIFFCHHDFIDSGLAAELSERLPFDCIGMTSMSNATEDGFDMYGLSLAVLTSDEVKFSAGMTPSITTNNYQRAIAELYQDLLAKTQEAPSFIVALLPYIADVGGADMVRTLDELCNGIPVWGSITSNINVTFGASSTVCNGQELVDGFALLFVDGDVSPEFIITSTPNQNISGRRALITASEGSILRTVNDMPVLDYLKSLGLDIRQENSTTTPLLVYYQGETEPVTLGIFTIFDDGSVLIGGEVPVGASFAVGEIDRDTIIAAAQSSADKIKATGKSRGAFLLPCVSRYIMLSPNQNDELELIKQELANTGMPYVMGYSGGEVCPVKDAEGVWHNRFHNYTFVSCVF